MKISVNDEHLFTLSEAQKKVMKHVVHSDEFEADMKRRLHWVLTHPYEVWFKQLKDEWEPKLAEPTRGIKTIPLNPDEFAELVFSQPDYKDRAAREKENTAIRADQAEEAALKVANSQPGASVSENPAQVNSAQITPVLKTKHTGRIRNLLMKLKR